MASWDVGCADRALNRLLERSPSVDGGCGQGHRRTRTTYGTSGPGHRDCSAHPPLDPVFVATQGLATQSVVANPLGRTADLCSKSGPDPQEERSDTFQRSTTWRPRASPSVARRFSLVLSSGVLLDRFHYRVLLRRLFRFSLHQVKWIEKTDSEVNGSNSSGVIDG